MEEIILGVFEESHFETGENQYHRNFLQILPVTIPLQAVKAKRFSSKGRLTSRDVNWDHDRTNQVWFLRRNWLEIEKSQNKLKILALLD